MDDKEKIISWNVLEYQYKEKHGDWYVAFTIAIVSASAASFLLGNILFGIFIIIAAFTLMMHSVKKPEIIHVEINNNGVIVSRNLYSYNDLKSFWVEDDTDNPKIILQLDKLLTPFVVIPLGEMPSFEVQDFLSEHLEEIEHREPITHKMMDYLGF